MWTNHPIPKRSCNIYSMLFSLEALAVILYVYVQDLCVKGEVKGILKIQRVCGGVGGGPGSVSSTLTVTYLVEEITDEPHTGDPTTTQHWLTESEIGLQPKFAVESSTVLLLKAVGGKLKGGEAAYPCEVLECVPVGGGGKIERRRASERTGERPQLVRAKSLEDQMLLQSGYGEKGECTFLHLFLAPFSCTIFLHLFLPLGNANSVA